MGALVRLNETGRSLGKAMLGLDYEIFKKKGETLTRDRKRQREDSIRKEGEGSR